MDMLKATCKIAVAAAALAATGAWAHPGHASGGTTTLMHLLTEPDHVLMLLAAIGVGVAAVIAARRSPRQNRRDRRD
jgi:hydrogenase/urease accessory protein HupE